MFRKTLLIIVVVLVVLSAFGCEKSKGRIAKTVVVSIQKTFSSDPFYIEHNLKITGLKVEKISKDTYKGIATIEYAEELHEVPVDISVNGAEITWDIEPDAWRFVPGFN
jgi:hypothetical protein